MKSNVYKRPDKPLFVSVKRRDDFSPIAKAEPIRIIAVDKATECHVTPDDVADRMVSYLGTTGDYLTLEPSAGTGQLSKALLRSGHSQFELTQVERHSKLAAELHRFGPVVNRCFLEWADEIRGRAFYPRIIMNPPFRDVRKHVAAAVSLMGRNGHGCPSCLVALVPVTFERDDAEELELLHPDTFVTAKVRTKIIRIKGD